MSLKKLNNDVIRLKIVGDLLRHALGSSVPSINLHFIIEIQLGHLLSRAFEKVSSLGKTCHFLLKVCVESQQLSSTFHRVCYQINGQPFRDSVKLVTRVEVHTTFG